MTVEKYVNNKFKKIKNNAKTAERNGITKSFETCCNYKVKISNGSGFIQLKLAGNHLNTFSFAKNIKIRLDFKGIRGL